ncbi:FTR1 family iron permease [Priestia koreensis]|uniref:FTR1 family iron permease n=1 Tax=Priestia koreensis TaxID=284581 RepID=UPI001F59DCA4|nr:FTR1 family protein [Priestia koreensis]MCM3007051.1 FTR1 family protein [Priestia koreensis]UNL85479.1 FTR1 family protein [Priestia koreensis]
MTSSLLLAFREGLEAFLVIGIILTQLAKVNKKSLSRFVYIGATLGLIVSIVVGTVSFNEAKELEEGSEELFEGIMMLVASGLIAYFILWLHRNSDVSASIKSSVNNTASGVGLLILSFLSVFREGMELVIFNLTQISNHAPSIATGSIIGIVLALGVAYLFVKATVKLRLNWIFKGLGILLILLGGELFAEGLVKLFEGGGEALEMIALAVFIIPSLYILLKKDIQKLRKSKNVAL